MCFRADEIACTELGASLGTGVEVSLVGQYGNFRLRLWAYLFRRASKSCPWSFPLGFSELASPKSVLSNMELELLSTFRALGANVCSAELWDVNADEDIVQAEGSADQEYDVHEICFS